MLVADFERLKKGIRQADKHASRDHYPKVGRLTARKAEALRAILGAAEAEGVSHADTMADILATAIWETGGRIYPVYETYARSAQSASRRLENAWRRGKLKGVKTPYWRREKGNYWVGRGMVQLTHRSGYMGRARAAVKKKFGVDILKDPESVMRVDISAFILVAGMLRGWFTGKKLRSFRARGKTIDYVRARAVVNPHDRKSFVPRAKLAERLEDALTSAGMFPAGVQDPHKSLTGTGTMRRIQERLRALGYYEVGTPDGIWGPRTQAGVLAFRNEHGLPLKPTVDAAFTAYLFGNVAPRKSAPARANATAKDLALMGSTDVARANTGMQTGAFLGAGAAVTGAAKTVLPMVKENSGALGDAIRLAGEAAAFVEGHAVFFVFVAGATVAWLAWRARANRVAKHRTGEYLSR